MPQATNIPWNTGQLAINTTNTFAYGFDNAWRMTNLVSSLAGGFIYGYNSQPSTLISQLRLPNGAYITNSFDSLARLTGTALNNHWGHTLDGYTYGYDALGLRNNITRDFGLTTSTVKAGYDSIGQLIAWVANETNGTLRQNEQLGWAYDAAHNLSRRTNNLLIQTFSVDAADELTSVERTGTFTLAGATPAPMASVTVNSQAAQTYGDFACKTATNGMNKRHPLESQHRCSFTLLTCPVREERSFRLSFRTLQHKGHPHPVLSRSTPRDFPLGLSPKISRPTELESRLHPAL